jgi:hypothetical protein
MGPDVDHSEQAVGTGLVLDIFPATRGRFMLHDEDAAPVDISYTVDANALRLTIGGALSAPPVVILNHFLSARRVTVNHAPHDRWRAEGGGLVIELPDAGEAEIAVWR